MHAYPTRMVARQAASPTRFNWKIPSGVESLTFMMAKAAEVFLSLNVTVYDILSIIMCLFFPAFGLRILHNLYHQIVAIVDMLGRKSKREQTEYEESVFRTLEQESRTLAAINIGNLLIKATATILSMLGVIGPTVVPSIIRKLSGVLFVGWLGSKIKAYTIVRSQTRAIPFILKNDRRRFLYNRFSDLVILCTAAATCLQIVGVPLQSLLTVGGIGGIALGLAAKEVTENVLGGCLLAVVSPFVPGDYIKTKSAGEHLVGRVTRVGFYSSTILGLDQLPTDVPNQHFVNARITNLSRVKHRRLQHSFFLRYEDINRVQTVVNGVRRAILDLPQVDPTIGFRVYFVGYTDSKLHIEVCAYLKDEGVDKFYDTQQFALLEIARVVEQCGAKFAYPLHIVNLQSDVSNKSLGLVTATEGNGELRKES